MDDRELRKLNKKKLIEEIQKADELLEVLVETKENK